mmetsp:Transcript_22032/g.25287  ORF Transcript_22032/g.25287 Transcript_22032/m.25287 type:complete len:86 (+) Transcript_22032:485-742(+)
MDGKISIVTGLSDAILLQLIKWFTAKYILDETTSNTEQSKCGAKIPTQVENNSISLKMTHRQDGTGWGGGALLQILRQFNHIQYQ